MDNLRLIDENYTLRRRHLSLPPPAPPRGHATSSRRADTTASKTIEAPSGAVGGLSITNWRHALHATEHASFPSRA